MGFNVHILLTGNERDRNDDVRWFWTGVSKRDTAGISIASDRRGDDLGRGADS